MTTKYKLRITGECKQNMKLCMRRGLPMNELWTVVGKLLNGEQLEEKYHAMFSPVTARGNGSAISVLTGCLSGKYMTKNLSLFY